MSGTGFQTGQINTEGKAQGGYIALRPHHGMCFQFYEGKGYSADFTDHMGKVIQALGKTPGQAVRLTTGTDAVCARCPNREGGICTSQEQVRHYDEEVLRSCGLREGDCIAYREFLETVRERIILSGRRAMICGDCGWDCLCREKQPQPLP